VVTRSACLEPSETNHASRGNGATRMRNASDHASKMLQPTKGSLIFAHEQPRTSCPVSAGLVGFSGLRSPKLHTNIADQEARQLPNVELCVELSTEAS
jgi:hypothetical protein